MDITTGNGNLPKVVIKTAHSTAEIYLLGATVTHFQKHGSEPLLFVSRESVFEEGKPIRGGIPIVFPWFGPREGKAQHGYARRATWEIVGNEVLADGSVRLTLRLPKAAEAAGYPEHSVSYTVTVGKTLRCELTVANESKNDPFSFETLLHTYLLLGDIERVSIGGLSGARYLDAVDNFTEKTDAAEAITIGEEVDRVYAGSTVSTELVDPVMGRRVRTDKSGSKSTVVWNPWIAKSQRMEDFGNDEYRHMICIEPGNVRADAITLKPGEATSLRIELSESPF